MDQFPLDRLVETVGSRYAVVVAAAERAKQIKDGSPPLVEIESVNPLTIALAEIAQGKVVIGDIPEGAEEITETNRAQYFVSIEEPEEDLAVDEPAAEVEETPAEDEDVEEGAEEEAEQEATEDSVEEAAEEEDEADGEAEGEDEEEVAETPDEGEDAGEEESGEEEAGDQDEEASDETAEKAS